MGLQSLPEGPLIAAARPKDKLLSMVGQLVEYDSFDHSAVLRKPCGKGRALKRPLPVLLFRVSANQSQKKVLGWPKSLLWFFCKMVWKNLN